MSSLRNLTVLGTAISMLALALFSAGCNNVSSSSPPPPPSSNGAMFITDFTNNTVTAYGQNANCTCNPARQISGGNTKISSPIGIAVGSNGMIYVANEAASTVTEYPIGGKGNIAPTYTIAAAAGLSSPVGVTVDAASNVYVTNSGTNSFDIFPPNSNTASNVISGPATGLNEPGFITLDAAGDIWVANIGGNSVEEFPPLSSNPTGNISPTVTIAGANTSLSSPQGIAFDPAGRLYVAINNQAFAAVWIYSGWVAGANNIAPINGICGAATGVINPTGVAINSLGTVFVVNSETQVAGYVTTFASNNIGNTACTGPPPNAAVSGPAMLNPAGIALH
jgi:sugar lactone lactonase YvrE